MVLKHHTFSWPNLIVGLLVTFACLAVYALPTLEFPTASLDGSWQFASNKAAATHLAFGRDFNFTSGPYAGIYTKLYEPSLDRRLLLGSLLLAFAASSGLLCLARGAMRVAVILVPAFLLYADQNDTAIFALCAIFVMVAFRLNSTRTPSGSLVLATGTVAAFLTLILALSLLPLIKGSLGAAAFGEAGIALAILVWQRAWRLALAGVMIFAAGMIGFWLLIGQQLADLRAYFIAQAPIISGYSEAMAFVGLQHSIAVTAAGMALVLGIVAIGVGRQSGLPGAGLVLSLTLLMAIVFKAGFVRQDGHEIMSANTMAILGLLLALELRPRASVAVLLLGLACWGAIALPIASGEGPLRLPAFHKDLAQAAHDLRLRLFDQPALTKDYDTTLNLIRQTVPFPDVAAVGSFDIYPVDQTLLLAHGLAWAPRPVMQSYSAYTPALARTNAAHLMGPEAPDTVLMRIGSIDYRLPALDDGLSWPILLQRYRVDSLQAGFAILRRRSDAHAVDDIISPDTVEPLQKLSAEMGKWIDLPSDQPLWAEIALRPTLLGRLANLVLKLPILQMSLRYGDGSVRHFRYLASTGQSGFVLSPTVLDVNGFVGLATRDTFAFASPPVAMAIGGNLGTRWLWPSRYDVTLKPFNLPQQPAVRGLLASGLLPASRPAAVAMGGECVADSIDKTAPSAVTQGGGVLRIRGWAAISPSQGIAAEALHILLIGADGTANSAAIKLFPRPDVAAAFHHPDMIGTGIDAILDVKGMSGRYNIVYDLDFKGGTVRCLPNRTVMLGKATE